MRMKNSIEYLLNIVSQKVTYKSVIPKAHFYWAWKCYPFRLIIKTNIFFVYGWYGVTEWYHMMYCVTEWYLNPNCESERTFFSSWKKIQIPDRVISFGSQFLRTNGHFYECITETRNIQKPYRAYPWIISWMEKKMKRKAFSCLNLNFTVLYKRKHIL